MATNPNLFSSWQQRNSPYATPTSSYAMPSAGQSSLSRAVSSPAPTYNANTMNSSGYSPSRSQNASAGGTATTPTTPNYSSSTYGAAPGPGFNQLSTIPTSANNILQDTAKLANSQFTEFGPLQHLTAMIQQAVLSGHAPEAIMPLLAPLMAQIAAQQQTAQRQAHDTLSGGVGQQAQADAMNASVGAGASAFQQLLQQILAGGMQEGTNVAQQAAAPLLGIASARNQQKQLQLAKDQAGGGGGLFGSLFG